ncbi:hypothetical protein GE107_24830 [Cohnella sp. CFH 77786]|uniref:hypothetical protein n=1 Tax=Cohnella sp. CFH 77786 TaxID=2662265 RepID=UPI001C60EC29|nr:hypothetical protein [Cohnella sp. CFH 77786]MBW5449254.1 hypothetical protein [Cohnella sp. CFH 77786]
MRSTQIVAGILLVSLAFNIYQWKTIKSNKQAEEAILSKNISFLGHDFVQASFSIENILTVKFDRGFQFGRAFALLNDASLRANGPLSQDRKYYAVWNKIRIRMERASSIVGQLADKTKLDENDVARLNRIKKMLDAYFEMAKKSNANTGYIDDQSLLEAEKAADQFNER